MVDLPRSSPADQQVDSRAVTAFLDALESRADIEMHSVMVVRHGHVVAEGWWAPYSAERVHLLYSVSKSFAATAVGIAQDEGLLDLDDTVISHFPELADQVDDPRSRSMRLRHLASMASGHTRDTMDEAFAADPGEPVLGFLRIPPDEEPGSVFAYNQPCTYTLAAVVQRRSGQPLTDYLRPRLLDPLGIGEVGWHGWPDGRRQLGFSGLHARTEDIAKLAQLHLQRGRWDGVQLVPATWVDEATSKHVDNPDQDNVDWRQGYGYQFWMQRHGYRGDGAFGQFCIVLPEHDTVVATTASTVQMQAVLDAVWEHLLPGLGTEDVDPHVDEDLRERLARLTIPALPGAATSPDRADHTFDAAVDEGTHHVTQVTCRTAADGLELTLTEPAGEVTFPVGDRTWSISTPLDADGGALPLAASGGWNVGTLAVDVLFLESAHRLHVRAAPGGRAEVTWNHPPLGFRRLQDMHSPR